MTPADLYNAIQADATAQSLAAAGNDAGCAARMTTVLPQVAAPIPMAQVLTWGAKTGVRAHIESHLSDATVAGNTTIGAICLIVRDMLQGPAASTLDITNADVLSMLDALAAVGVLNASGAGSKADLLALGNTPQVVTADDVSLAMLPHRPNGKIA